MLESELRINLLDNFAHLTTAIDALCDAIMADERLVAWLQEIREPPMLTQSRDNARQQCCSVLKQLEYLDEQQPREIIVAAGFVGSSAETLEMVNSVNHQKISFKQSMLALKNAKINIRENHLAKGIQAILSKRPSSTSTALNTLGLSRLHLKQCYRQIPILNEAPKKITWTWAHTRSIKKITAEKAIEMLGKKGQSTNIELQIKKCQGLSPSEPLAIIQELAPHLRANIVIESSAQTKRLMVKGPLPIFFPAESCTPCPDFKPPKEKQDKNKNRMIRNDVRIEAEVFLPAIRAHRYIVK